MPYGHDSKDAAVECLRKLQTNPNFKPDAEQSAIGPGKTNPVQGGGKKVGSFKKK